jgi:hypothetical protein
VLSLVVHGELVALDKALVLVHGVLVDLEDELLLVQTLRVDLDRVVYGVVVGFEEVELDRVVQGLVEAVEAVHCVPAGQEVLNMVVAGVQVQVLQLVVTMGLPAVLTWYTEHCLEVVVAGAHSCPSSQITVG